MPCHCGLGRGSGLLSCLSAHRCVTFTHNSHRHETRLSRTTGPASGRATRADSDSPHKTARHDRPHNTTGDLTSQTWQTSAARVTPGVLCTSWEWVVICHIWAWGWAHGHRGQAPWPHSTLMCRTQPLRLPIPSYRSSYHAWLRRGVRTPATRGQLHAPQLPRSERGGGGRLRTAGAIVSTSSLKDA